MQKLRDDVKARFNLFKFEVATMVLTYLQARSVYNELEELLCEAVKLVSEGSTWEEVYHISLTLRKQAF
jgi:hypothetical protein